MKIYSQYQTCMFETHRLLTHNVYSINFINGNPYTDSFIQFIDNYLYYVKGYEGKEVDNIDHHNNGTTYIYLHFDEEIRIELKIDDLSEVYEDYINKPGIIDEGDE